MTPLMRASLLLAAFLLPAGDRLLGTEDAVVAQDGSGQFRSIQEAVSAAPITGLGRAWVIAVRPGIYRERVYVQRERGDIVLRASNAGNTILTSSLYAGMAGPDGKPIGTFRTPTLQVDGDGFRVEGLTIANEAGPVGQAVAVRVDGDRVSFSNCRFLGWQDTVLVNRGRHYFANCYIEGHIDFIFGGATAFFDHCEIRCLGNGYVTAASTPAGVAHGLVFADCRISGAEGARAYLGRPWRDHARVEFLRTYMSGTILPSGWDDWGRPVTHQTALFAEFESSGPGAQSSARVPWSRRLSAQEASRINLELVLSGTDGWKPAAEQAP